MRRGCIELWMVTTPMQSVLKMGSRGMGEVDRKELKGPLGRRTSVVSGADRSLMKLGPMLSSPSEKVKW